MSEKQKSIYQKYEDATRAYYGADKDPLKLVPVVTNKDIAHGLAQQVERGLGKITEEDLASDALRAQRRNRLMPSAHGETDLQKLQERALEDKLRMVVVNTELTHAAQAPGDFNEDAEKAGAYEMGIGHVIPHPPQQPPTRK
jgi:hypothetical protein